MAQFDVHRLVRLPGLVLNCQTDLLDHIDSRFVVPLVPVAVIVTPSRHLNPVFAIEDEDFAMLTQSAASIRKTDLGRIVVSLADHDIES